MRRIKHLKIIGSICYVHIPCQRRKIDRKAIKGYLVGCNGEERYRVWVKDRNSVIASRDVTFQEKFIQCKDVKLEVEDCSAESQF